jgi:hypothetical protein
VRLFVESVLPVDPATAWDLFESDDFRARLRDRAGVTSEVVWSRTEGATIVRRMRFQSGTELPSMVAKLLGTNHLRYEQENRLEPAASRLSWTVHLPVLSDRVKVAGATTIFPDPEGCRRVLDGVCEVKVALIGGQIEKAVVGEFQKSMARAVEIVREMIEERSG